jgi:hypothetical protein
MPGWGATAETGPFPPGTIQRFKEGRIGARLIDMHGNVRSVGVTVHDTTFTDNQARDIGNAAARLSNAALFEVEACRRDFVMLDDVTAYDEGYSSNSDYANFFWQNDNNPTMTVTYQVPAFDALYIKPGGVIDLANSNVDAFIDAVTAALGGGWTFIRAWMTVDGKGGPQAYSSDAPQVEEPGIGADPGSGPGT